MTKRTIEGYRPIGLAKAIEPGHRYISDAFLDELIEIAGPLPERSFGATVLNDEGQLIEVTITAREKFIRCVETAAAGYHLAKEEQSKPTAAQLAAEFVGIERAAARLLRALQVGLDGDVNSMPDALRHNGGLQSWAADEADRLAATATNREAYPPDELWAATRLRKAIEGIAAIHRWSASASKRKLASKQRDAARRRVSRGSVHARNEGDKPLNEYLHRVIADCWQGVCLRPDADGPKLLGFTRVAAEAVGTTLSELGARERLRRRLGWRTGKSKRS